MIISTIIFTFKITKKKKKKEKKEKKTLLSNTYARLHFLPALHVGSRWYFAIVVIRMLFNTPSDLL
jgi:hypothetical protein